jgi:hypothetical protein
MKRGEPEERSIRGIWRAPYLQDGYPVIIAVDSQGRRIGEVVMVRGMSPSRVRFMLTELLDAADPRPRLVCV